MEQNGSRNRENNEENYIDRRERWSTCERNNEAKLQMVVKDGGLENAYEGY